MALGNSMHKLARKRVETPQAQTAWMDRNQRQQDFYYKEYNVQQHEKKDQDEFNKVDAKLQEQILTTVASEKKAILQKIYIAWKRLTNLQVLTAWPLEY